MIAIETLTNNVIEVILPQTLQAQEIDQVVRPKLGQVIAQYGKACVLVDARLFEGWADMEAAEHHLAMVRDHQENIDRVAVI